MQAYEPLGPRTPLSISPIMKLKDDILGLIFALNADMDNPPEYDSSRDATYSTRPPALDTTRRTSQVCQAWRDVLLASPSIWGQVIRLDKFKKKRSGKWRDEVMKRTGNAKLCIKGEVQSDILDLSAFFVELLEGHWSRIKKLDCRIGGKKISESTLRRLFSRPAPNLESFTMIFGERQKLEMAQDWLFSGDSPLLQKLSTCRMTFGLPHLWRMNIRSLKFEEGQFHPIDVLQLIRQTPFLEYLELSNINPAAVSQKIKFEPINLPNLRDLRLKTPLHFGLPIADGIKPAADCRLHWDSLGGHSLKATTDQGINAVCRILDRYSQTSFLNRTINSLVLDIDDKCFRFETTPISPKPRVLKLSGLEQLVYPTTFSVHLVSLFPSGFSVALINSLSHGNFHTVTKFRFDPDSSSDLKSKWWQIEGLFKALSSVETLMISNYGLDILLESTEDTDKEIIFPLLRNLEFSRTRAAPSSFASVFPFLETRHQTGYSIQLLDLTANPTGNWGFLERFNGLTVKWSTVMNTKEYVCGSGDERKLYLHNWDVDSEFDYY